MNPPTAPTPTPIRTAMELHHVKAAHLYPAIKAALDEWSAGAAEMTDEMLARALRAHGPHQYLTPNGWLAYRAIGLGMRLMVGRDRHGDFCRLVEGIQLGRPTVELTGLVAKELMHSGLLREMEEHDTRSHGGWRNSRIKGEGSRVYALEM